MTKYRYVQAAISQPQFAELKVLAARKDVSMTALLRYAILQLLAENHNIITQEALQHGKTE